MIQQIYQTTYSSVSTRDYSLEYLNLHFPDPRLISTEEKDKWDISVRHNSTKNSNKRKLSFLRNFYILILLKRRPLACMKGTAQLTLYVYIHICL
jgi:hypothetical protein